MRGPCPAAASTSARGSRSRSRRRDAWLQAEAIDLTHEGLGVAVRPRDRRDDAGGGRGRQRPLHGSRGLRRAAAGGGALRRQPADRPGNAPAARALARARDDAGSPTSIGARASATRAPEALPAFAAAACPWFFRETLHFRIVAVGAGGMTLRTTHAHPPLLPRARARLRAAPRVDRGRERPRAADVGAPRRGQRRLRGRRRVGRSAARAAERAVALPPGRRRRR